MKKSLSMLAAVLFTVSGAAVAGDVAAGKTKYLGTCAACHGPAGEGNPALKAPNLTAFDAAHISKQLTGFKAGTIEGTTMPAMAAGLSDADIANLAAYIETL